MRLSRWLLSTMREQPTDADTASHRLMLRAGLIRRVSSGIYNWLPTGVRVLHKVAAVIRSEMCRSGAQEVIMPMVQPKELWQQSGRWQDYGSELLRFNDRHRNDFCLGPTHEEIITDLIRREINSYKLLPLNLFQIQNKFRDEIRPRFGAMRSREFLMKDAYSFHTHQASLQETYELMGSTYERIFTRLGLNFCRVRADSGSIGGNMSEEFHVLASSGEDAIAISDKGSFASNVERAEVPAPGIGRPQPQQQMQSIDTGEGKTIAAVSEQLKIAPRQMVKTLVVENEKGGLTALLLRGDHRLNAVKAAKISGLANPLKLAEESRITAELKVGSGNLGPVDLKLPIVVDQAVSVMSDFVCGANRKNRHLTGVNWERDCTFSSIADLREIQEGDPSPTGDGTISIQRGIEVGHIFQLGEKYSRSMAAKVLNSSGKLENLLMGCYGIGVSRIVPAAIEQNHDANGIIWPVVIAPWQIIIVPINQHRSVAVQQAAESFYTDLRRQFGDEVLLDDREESTGVKLAESELLGIPHRVVIGSRSLREGHLEYFCRRSGSKQKLAPTELLNLLKQNCFSAAPAF